MRRSLARFMAVGIGVIGLVAGCGQPNPNRVQGYVEGEYVYVASPHAGALGKLGVQRGMRVKAGEFLFSLDPEPEKSACDEAGRRVTQARATVEDMKKGKRPEEIDSAEAQLRQARAALVLSESNLGRVRQLIATGTGSRDDLDKARSQRNQDHQRVQQLEADLKTARLGTRYDQINASEANLQAMEAVLARAEWDLAQKRQTAPQAGLVFDTLYRVGEWVPAGKPLVVLLPPANVKVRAFVSEQQVGALHLGERVRVAVDGVPEAYTGTGELHFPASRVHAAGHL